MDTSRPRHLHSLFSGPSFSPSNGSTPSSSALRSVPAPTHSHSLSLSPTQPYFSSDGMNPNFARLPAGGGLDRLLSHDAYGADFFGAPEHAHGNGNGNGNGSGSGNGNGGGGGVFKDTRDGRYDGLFDKAPTQPAAKRVSRACVACRKGKNRCEGDPASTKPCRRCEQNGIACVFEKSSEKRDGRARTGSNAGDGWSGDAEGRVSHLERSVQDLASGQSQIQNALQQILSMLPQAQNPLPTPSSLPGFLPQPDPVNIPNVFAQNTSPPAVFGAQVPAIVHAPIAYQQDLGASRSPQNTASGRQSDRSLQDDRAWPKLPGFKPPNHRFGTYGIIPLSSAPPSPSRSRHSSRSSSAHSVTSNAAIPQASLAAPIQALQALANAADQAAAGEPDDHPIESRRTSEDDIRDDEERGRSRKRKRVTIGGKSIHFKVRKQTKPDPTPRNPFPDVVTKGLVAEVEARELWDVFFSGCHYFVPLWDKKYDTYETFIERTPFSTNGLLAVAAKIRAGNGALGQTFQRCLEEAQGIARSTLFGPIVRKEAVMAMIILSVWSQNGWLPGGHALRMGLDINLHRALEKLNDGEERTEAEERDLVVSARIWLNCYLHDHLSSLGNGKPILLRDDSSVRGARTLLSHPMASETDASLVARVELVNIRIHVLDHLAPLHGKLDSPTISFVQQQFSELDEWYSEWSQHFTARGYHEDAVLVRLLEVDLAYAKLWIVCVALRGCHWQSLSEQQKQLVYQAKDASLRCLQIFLQSANFRAHLKYATHETLVSAAFCSLFLIKIAYLYPSLIPSHTLSTQISGIVHVLSSECSAGRYALSLKLMLAKFRRKTGTLSTVPGTPSYTATTLAQTLPAVPSGDATHDLDGGLQSLLSLPPPLGDGFGNTVGATHDGLADFDWPLIGDGDDGFSLPSEFSPSALPSWMQDNSLADLGLPVDGSDSLFLPFESAVQFFPPTNTNAGFQFTFPDAGDFGGEAW
ncbi:hypothetical protein Q5752_001142 [Cryptotrichosporon argae]